MTEHSHDCGHNHDPNPWIGDDDREMYGNLTRAIFRMSVLTASMDRQLTMTYGACMLVSVAGQTDGDVFRVARALSWEAASVVNMMAGGQEPELLVHAANGDDISTDALDASSPFAFSADAMKAFFSAASVGNLAGAVAVLSAVRLEAERQQEDPDAHAAQFYGNVMVSVGFSAGQGLQDLLHFFKP